MAPSTPANGVLSRLYNPPRAKDALRADDSLFPENEAARKQNSREDAAASRQLFKTTNSDGTMSSSYLRGHLENILSDEKLEVLPFFARWPSSSAPPPPYLTNSKVFLFRPQPPTQPPSCTPCLPFLTDRRRGSFKSSKRNLKLDFTRLRLQNDQAADALYRVSIFRNDT